MLGSLLVSDMCTCLHVRLPLWQASTDQRCPSCAAAIWAWLTPILCLISFACHCSNKDFIELEIPPDCGNGTWNAGIPLARLLFHVPAPALLSLLAALLLERRIILVSQDRDLVSAAVHAATALLYPMRWQHIYLPLLPNALKVQRLPWNASCHAHDQTQRYIFMTDGGREAVSWPSTDQVRLNRSAQGAVAQEDITIGSHLKPAMVSAIGNPPAHAAFNKPLGFSMNSVDQAATACFTIPPESVCCRLES